MQAYIERSQQIHHETDAEAGGADQNGNYPDGHMRVGTFRSGGAMAAHGTQKDNERAKLKRRRER